MLGTCRHKLFQPLSHLDLQPAWVQTMHSGGTVLNEEDTQKKKWGEAQLDQGPSPAGRTDAIRNLVLLPAPLQTVAQKPCRPMPRRSIRGQTCGFDDSPNAIKGEIFPQNCQRRSIKRKTHDPDGS